MPEENVDPWGGPIVRATDVPVRDFMTVTLKGGSQDSWIVFHFDSVDEALETLDPENQNLPDLMEYAAKAEASFVKAVQSAKGSSGGRPAASGGNWGNKKKSSGDGTECQHGEMELKTGGGPGTGKRAWKAYMCPEKKCDPIWQ